ncbi:hypothetical protein IWW50_004406 [Coemansia erecta]|nr:hypothetical protein IWW50_004406 [Coemansia erecta]
MPSMPQAILDTHSEQAERSKKGKTATRSLLDVLGQAGKRISKTPSLRSQSSSLFSSQRSSRYSSPQPQGSRIDPVEQQRRVDAVVDEYMVMADREESGFVDVSRMRRRLGVGPKKMNECSVYYELFGTGPRRLFLVMGMMGCTMYWRLQTRYFAGLGDYTVCVFDNCGSGRSTVAPGPYRISQLARDACRVLEHIGWHEDIHMVGISLGGMIAQELCVMSSPRPQFASVAFADTWHNAALAVPTVSEVRFAFSGMAALGDNPRHVINLAFSRDWIDSEFHDTAREAVLGEAISSAMTNREVMNSLFRAIWLQLSQHQGAAETHAEKVSPKSSPGAGGRESGENKSPGSADLPLDNVDQSLADEDLPLTSTNEQLFGKPLSVQLAQQVGSQHSSPGPAVRPRPVGHSLTEPSRKMRTRAPIPPEMAASTTVVAETIKREVSGDIHQFMACLAHRFSSQRVRQIRAQNPSTRFLVIHGEKDRVIRPVCGRTLAKLLECPIVWIKRGGHMPPIDSHCTFNTIVRAFTRDERWLRELPDRTSLVPASWDEQVRVRRWISAGPDSISVAGTDHRGARLSCSIELPDSAAAEPAPSDKRKGARRDSRIDHIRPVGPLHRELFFVDEANPDLPARIIPPNATTMPPLDQFKRSESDLSTSQSQPKESTRELTIYGALLDASLRIRRYP